MLSRVNYQVVHRCKHVLAWWIHPVFSVIRRFCFENRLVAHAYRVYKNADDRESIRPVSISK